MEYILNNLDGGILKIELNRPQKRNALTLDMYTQFAELLNTAQTKPEIRVVLVSAAGDNYSAGNDLQDFLNHPPGSGDSPQKQMIDALRVLDKPLVGAVRGAAVGSGATMLTYFDFVYASQNARFQYPFINLALVPEFGTSFSLPIRSATFARLRSSSSGILSTLPAPSPWGSSPRSCPMPKSLPRRKKSHRSWHRSH
jgi:enoyl-CoA hydratase/carnithine racemase